MTKKTDRIKKQILNALSDNRKKVIQIEISRSEYVNDKWNIRIGDILGSTEFSNASLKDVLDEIKCEMERLRR